MRIFVLIFFAFVAIPLLAQQEQVTAFGADIIVDNTSSITVTEKIDIISRGDRFKRGIVRYIPKHKADSAGKSLNLNLKIISVLKDGVNEKYHTKNSNDNLEIYVGERDTYIADGAHSYQITYRANNVIGFNKNFDELYWNVNGFGWDFTIQQVTANITFPRNAKIYQTACYTGSYGSRDSNCEFYINGNTVQFIANNLYPNQNLTIATGIEKGILTPPPPPPPPSWFEQFGLLLVGIILSLFLLAYYYFTWRKHGIDPPKPIVYPLFDPPNNLSPASVGMIHKERFWDDLVTSSLVNLAVKGFIEIEEKVEKKFFGLNNKLVYTLKKLKNSQPTLPQEEARLLDSLFSGREEVILDGEYKFYVKDAIAVYKNEMKKQHGAMINEGNNYKFLILPILLMIAFVILSVMIASRTNNFDIFSFLLGGISFLPFLFFILAFSKAIFKYHFKWIFILIGCIIIISVMIFMVTHPLNLANINAYSFGGFLCFGIISFALYSYYIKRPSEKKLQLKSMIEGFEMYLGAAEEKRIQSFNSPEITPQVFEKLLPYAMVLGVEEIWGEKFEIYLRKTSTDVEYQNSWYSGNNFNAMHFGHHLNSGLSNSMSSAGTPPSDSGSGSGGGGFSGGGGGGGGGGGW